MSISQLDDTELEVSLEILHQLGLEYWGCLKNNRGVLLWVLPQVNELVDGFINFQLDLALYRMLYVSEHWMLYEDFEKGLNLCEILGFKREKHFILLVIINKEKGIGFTNTVCWDLIKWVALKICKPLRSMILNWTSDKSKIWASIVCSLIFSSKFIWGSINNKL